MKEKNAQRMTRAWDIHEVELSGPRDGNPFVDVSLRARFQRDGRRFDVEGFYDGNGVYRIRFMPDKEGPWSCRTSSSARELDGIESTFVCGPAAEGRHGPVQVVNRFHFAYADGTRYIPVGTTCYAWTHQGEDLEEQTLESLKTSPFNKIRMCVFPKHYDYNHNEPPLYPFQGAPGEGWDFTRPSPDFFRHLERRIGNLRDLGIEADLILFHPYDRWGFSDMGREADGRYLHYVVARLAAYSNLWWSLANEYDLPSSYGLKRKKSETDWERLARIIVKSDPCAHLRSIHNCRQFYDHRRPWITHCSIQRQDVYRTAENTDQWREKYQKPVVIDECAYEGNVNHGWGNITAEELVRRCWEGAVRGGYVGHGETYLHPREILWWSKGGALHGKSPARIGFLRKILEQGPRQGIGPISFGLDGWDLPCGGVPGEYYLFYFGFNQPAFRTFRMPEGAQFTVDVIDTWNMTIQTLPGVRNREFRIELPGRPFMAVRMLKA